MLQRAYDVKAYQISGPDWLRAEPFDVAVVIPEGATKEQIAAMWRNLLAARFGVKVRVEKKEFPVDDLVVGPRGHKLEETPDANLAALAPPANGGSPFGKDGKLSGAALVMMMERRPSGVSARLSGKAQPIAALVNALSNELGHPVVDKTGLSGKYDFTIEYAPIDSRFRDAAQSAAPVAAAPELGLDLATAIQQQLGLRMELGKGMLDYVVVEKAEHVPTEN
jgi:uncharacterized protein (TIGR03435 family)